MITQQEIDRICLEAQLEVDALFNEFYEELVGERGPILALLQQRELAQAQETMEAENETLVGGMEGV